MNPNCIAQVSKAAGRALTATEIKKIDDQMDSAMRQLARQDPKGWQAKSMDTRVTEAAQMAMGNLKEAALRKAENAQRQVLKTAATESRIGDQARLHPEDKRAHGLVRDMERTGHYINGIKHLGNLAGSMLPADVWARFKRAQGHQVLYICATDEHGTPFRSYDALVQFANGKEAQDAAAVRFNAMNAQGDAGASTSDGRHHRA
jgi:hypothetical protein